MMSVLFEMVLRRAIFVVLSLMSYSLGLSGVCNRAFVRGLHLILDECLDFK